LPIAIVAIGVIVAVAMAGHGATKRGNRPASVGKQGGGTVARGDLAVAARYLGLSDARLRSELRSGRTLAEVANSSRGRSAKGLVGAIVSARSAGLAAAVAAGQLTRADERASLATLPGRVSTRVNRTGGYGVGGPPDLLAAAHYLGTSVERLRAELRAGHALADVANSTSRRSAAGLIATLIAQRRSRLDATVAAGGLSRERARELVASLDKRVRAEVMHRR
jgi:hypothetical protein